MEKQFKFLNQKELVKLSTKERQVYQERLIRDRKETGKSIATSLKKGLLEGVVTE